MHWAGEEAVRVLFNFSVFRIFVEYNQSNHDHPIHCPGVEAVWVLVRGSDLLQPRTLWSRLQPRLHHHLPLPRGVCFFSKNLIFLVIWLSRVQITPKTDLRRSKNVISVPWGAPPDTSRCSALRYPVPCHEVSAAAPWGTLWLCPLRYSVLIFRPSPGQFQGWAKELYPTSDFWWRIPRYHHHFPLPDIFSSLQGTVVIFGNLSQMRRQTFNQLLAALAVCDIL